MAYQVEHISPVQCKVSVTVPAEEINKVMDKAVRRVGASVSIPGFRKGKVPANVVEKRFIEDIVSNATDQVVNEYISNALDEHKLQPLTRVQYDGGDVARGQEFSFSFTFEVLPEIALPEDLTALSVEVESSEPSAKDVEELTTRLRKSMAKLDEITEEGALPQLGQVVQVDIDGVYEGKSVPGMKADNFLMQMREEEDSKAVELNKLVLTLPAGGEGQSILILPEDYPDVELRGKTIDMKVKVHKIFNEILPELDDDAAKQYGFSDVTQLRRMIVEQTMRSKAMEVRAKGQEKLLQAQLEGLEFPVPDSIMNMHRQAFMAEAREYWEQQGVSGEELETKLAGMKEDCEKAALEQGRAQAFLTALAHRDNVNVSEQEVDQQVRQMAQEAKQDYERVRQMLMQTGVIYSIQARLLASKASMYMFSRAKKVVVGPDGKPLPEEAAIQEITPVNPFPAEADNSRENQNA